MPCSRASGTVSSKASLIPRPRSRNRPPESCLTCCCEPEGPAEPTACNSCHQEYSGLQRMSERAARALSLVGWVALWWVAAQVTPSPQLLPGPLRVLSFAWREVLNGELPVNVGI